MEKHTHQAYAVSFSVGHRSASEKYTFRMTTITYDPVSGYGGTHFRTAARSASSGAKADLLAAPQAEYIWTPGANRLTQGPVLLQS